MANIAIYKFDSSIKASVLPTFNLGYSTYTYTDVNNNGIITRTITCDTLPTKMTFVNETSLLGVDFLEVSNLTTFNDLFSGCSKLEYVNTEGWNTSKVTDMRCVFNSCVRLTNVDLSVFDTSGVQLFIEMCNNLGSSPSSTEGIIHEPVDLSGWDMSSATSMARMFQYAKFTELNLSGWQFGSGAYLTNMFTGCSKLVKLNLSGWNMDNVPSDGYKNMFCHTDGAGYIENLMEVDMTGCSATTVNRILERLPARTEDAPGKLIYDKDLEGVDVDTIEAKHWREKPFDASTLANKFVDGEKLNSFAKLLKSNIKNDLLGDKKLRYLTQAEYDALTDDKKNDENIIYNITDADIPDYVTQEELNTAIANAGPSVVMLSQTEYDALGSNINPETLYIIG